MTEKQRALSRDLATKRAVRDIAEHAMMKKTVARFDPEQAAFIKTRAAEIGIPVEELTAAAAIEIAKSYKDHVRVSQEATDAPPKEPPA